LGGQAKEMRGENNAFGIVTKKLPSNTNDSFMTDTELDSNKREITNDVNRIIDEFKTGKYKKIVLPTIGVGLAKLNTKAPLTWNHLQAELNRLESTVNTTNQTESNSSVRDMVVEKANELIKKAPSKANNIRKDIEMIKLSDGFIGTIVPESSPKYISATDFYKNAWGNLANNDFKGMNRVMISGSGPWNPNRFGGKISDNNISDHFNNFYVPMINKAISQGVESFSVGIAEGIDVLTGKYLASLGWKNITQNKWNIWYDPTSIPFSPIRDTKIDYNKAEDEKLDLFNKLMNKEPYNECNN
jgi:hypothetical protein